MTSATSPLTLSTAIGSYGHFEALKTGTVEAPGLDLRFEEAAPITEAFKRMCRELAYDVSEMSITGYLLAKLYGKGFTALPVFPVRAFGSSHTSIFFNARSGVRDPRDLEGRSVGARAYTGTASLWTRGVLMREYSVDPGKVTWVSSEEEHVLEYHKDAPPNAVYKLGADLSRMLREGELAAGIGVSGGGSAEIKPLISGARYAAREWYMRTGIYQINHVIVVKDSLLREHAWLAESLYDAFCQAKQRWLASGPDLSATADLDLADNDPFPYGVEANRSSIQALLDFAHEQSILPRQYSIDEMFPLTFG